LEKGAAGGAAGVDRLLGRPQPHALLLQQSDDCGEVRDGARQTIDARHDKSVALATKVPAHRPHPLNRPSLSYPCRMAG
jgi:hypothetical protein